MSVYQPKSPVQSFSPMKKSSTSSLSAADTGGDDADVRGRSLRRVRFNDRHLTTTMSSCSCSSSSSNSCSSPVESSASQSHVRQIKHVSLSVITNCTTKDGVHITWEEAEVAALDRHGWRRSVAQCVQLDTG